MTKIISFFIAALILTLTTSQTNPPKTYKVDLTLDQWNAVLDCVDKSQANHLQVKGVQELILPQLQKQLQADTTKKK